MATSLQQSERPSSQAGRSLLASAQEVFGPRLKAAWLSGSYAYEGALCHRSDVDVVIVLDESTPIPADNRTISLIRRFVDDYLAIHSSHGFDPDLEFPGEFVTPAMLDETIRWRGLAYEGGLPEPEFPPVRSSDYWLGRPDRWYNAWLSMTAFSRFPIGDRDYHSAAKLGAWKTILRFLLLRAGGAPVAADDLLDGLAQFGVKPRYPAFWEAERECVQAALEALAAEGAARLAGGRIEPNGERLGDWEAELRAMVERGSPPPLLLDIALHREVEDHAAQRWQALEAIQG